MQSVIFIMLLFFINLAMADEQNVTLHGGMLRFQGEVYSDTCTVNDGDMLLAIPMGKSAPIVSKKQGIMPMRSRLIFGSNIVAKTSVVIWLWFSMAYQM